MASSLSSDLLACQQFFPHPLSCQWLLFTRMWQWEYPPINSTTQNPKIARFLQSKPPPEAERKAKVEKLKSQIQCQQREFNRFTRDVMSLCIRCVQILNDVV